MEIAYACNFALHSCTYAGPDLREMSADFSGGFPLSFFSGQICSILLSSAHVQRPPGSVLTGQLYQPFLLCRASSEPFLQGRGEEEILFFRGSTGLRWRDSTNIWSRKDVAEQKTFHITVA